MAPARRPPRTFWRAALAAALVLPPGSPGCDTRSGPAPQAASPAGSRERAFPKDAVRELVEVSRVVDGDTLILADGRTVRYLAIDAPEPGAPFHDAATALHRRLVEAHRVELVLFPDGPERDDYGRTLGAVAVSNRGETEAARTYAGAEIVRSGLAWVYQKDPDSLPRDLLRSLLEAQREALREGRGVWSILEGSALPDLRATRLRIHRASCEHLRDARPRRVGDVAVELARGKSPCRSCRPLFAEN